MAAIGQKVADYVANQRQKDLLSCWLACLVLLAIPAQLLLQVWLLTVVLVTPLRN